MGYNFLAAVLLLAVVGYKLDEHFNQGKYWFTMVGLFLALFYGFYDVFRKVKYLENLEAQDLESQEESNRTDKKK